MSTVVHSRISVEVINVFADVPSLQALDRPNEGNEQQTNPSYTAKEAVRGGWGKVE